MVRYPRHIDIFGDLKNDRSSSIESTAMFDKLKRIFIVEDEISKKYDPKSDDNSTPEVIEPTAATIDDRGVPNVDPSTVPPSSKFTEILLGAMDAQNSEGFDYLEFKESLQSLGKMNMDEATRFKSAFAMAQTMGATSHKLISTAEQYKKILSNEKVKFDQALENQKSKQITQVQQGISELEKAMSMKQNRIQEIKKEIAADRAKLEKAKVNLEGAGAKIANTKAGFMASLVQIVHQLDADIEKMKKYLK